MGYFDGFGDYNNTTGVQVTASNTTIGDSAKKQVGNSYSEQQGNATTFSVGNSNTLRRGVINSLTEGFNFSTVLGPAFSTYVGCYTPTTAGGKIEFVSPFAVKQTLGAWDVDIKVAIQNKVNKGTVYDFNTSTTYESKTGRHYKLKPSGDETFAKQMTTYAAKADSIIQEIRQLVTNVNTTLGTRIEQVAVSDTKTVVGSHSITAGNHEFKSTMGSTMRMGSFISMNGSMLSFAGEVIQLG